MAGLEQLEIHSKSYIVRWVRVEEGHTISWSVQPHKKSINFGIFKHPGTNTTGAGTIPPQPSSPDETGSSSSQHQLEPSSTDKARRPSSARNDASTAQEQLKAKGFLPAHWYGKCEADKVSMGTYDVHSGSGGMYGLVFDNTFSRQVSKTATFVLLTYPTNAPPHATHHLQNTGAGMSNASLSKALNQSSPNMGAASESADSLHSHLALGASASKGNSVAGRNEDSIAATYHVGVLQKRRRRRGQGYARRFFSLDFASCTLSYYYNRNSSALRGAIPLSLAAIAADERRREISIDSGAEIWHLKAGNAKDFMEWARALEKASNAARGVGVAAAVPATERERLTLRTSGIQNVATSQEEEREWEQVEALVSRIVGTRDAVRRLSKDTAPGSGARNPFPGLGISSATPFSDENVEHTANTAEKRSFWRRKSSQPPAPQLFGRSIQTQLGVPSPATVNIISANGSAAPAPRKVRHQKENSIHDHCSALLGDLDAVIQDFSTLLANSKRRRMPVPLSASRRSIESTSTAEFYDAEPGDIDRSQMLLISHQNQSEEDTQASSAEDGFATDSSSISSADDDTPNLTGTASLFPPKPKTFDPLPLPILIARRKTVPPAACLPPSLIGFLRKNVGKDLSTISMPVSANEPVSLLQRTAEQLEYAHLLDTAVAHKLPTQRLLHVAAFAVSQFSANRAKERAIRKPFNPMLGETFELIRTNKEIPGGFRLLVEKVSHRPVRLACQADSANWSFSQSPAPTQKFWGKSAELITEGRARIALRLADGTDELYSWTTATAFLRNIVMGEKYIEPVGAMTVVCESTGAKACVEFKTKGMFGGRSEDVSVDAYRPDGVHSGMGLSGTWTSNLRIVESGKAAGGEIWRVGELVDDAANRYGWTSFAAGLNEVTEIERGKLPPTDSRLRPDQRAVERGDLDRAEEMKGRLEEGQRARRTALEERGEGWKPRWFVKVEGTGEGAGADAGEEVWRLKGGKEGYWEERAKGTWTGVEDLFAV